MERTLVEGEAMGPPTSGAATPPVPAAITVDGDDFPKMEGGWAATLAR